MASADASQTAPHAAALVPTIRRAATSRPGGVPARRDSRSIALNTATATRTTAAKPTDWAVNRPRRSPVGVNASVANQTSPGHHTDANPRRNRRDAAAAAPQPTGDEPTTATSPRQDAWAAASADTARPAASDPTRPMSRPTTTARPEAANTSTASSATRCTSPAASGPCKAATAALPQPRNDAVNTWSGSGATTAADARDASPARPTTGRQLPAA